MRWTYRDLQPIVPSRDYFMPESAEAKLPAYFGPEDRKRLIANGTYKPDGTVNLETAERLGWTRMWEERKRDREAAIERARDTALGEPSARQVIGE